MRETVWSITVTGGDPVSTDIIDGLAARVEALNPSHILFFRGALSSLTVAEQEDLVDYIRFCLATGMDMEFVAQSYDLIVKDTLAEQMYFLRHNRYRHSRLSEVMDSVYGNPDYMRKYMIGLAVSAFLWPNHKQIKDFFLATVAALPQGGAYVEVGPGHGYFMMKAIGSGKFTQVTGIDLSATSLEITRDVLDYYWQTRHLNTGTTELLHGDFLDLTLNMPNVAMFVAGEVLEHVEQPYAFMQRIHASVSAGTLVFITTCINAPAIDHISLFRSVTELETLLIEAGFVVRDRLLAPYTGKSLEECERRRLAVNVAYCLEKR